MYCKLERMYNTKRVRHVCDRLDLQRLRYGIGKRQDLEGRSIPNTANSHGTGIRHPKVRKSSRRIIYRKTLLHTRDGCVQGWNCCFLAGIVCMRDLGRHRGSRRH